MAIRKKMKKELKVDVLFKQEKLTAQEEKQKRFLAKFGFVQLVFDFYRSPVS